MGRGRNSHSNGTTMIDIPRKDENMCKIVIRGNKRYISYMKRHLRKEHPSTRSRMR